MNVSTLDYDSAKALIQDPDPEVRLRVARNPTAPAETLYFLADDPSLDVRIAVAENPATPRLANLALAKDPDFTVRCALARKFVGDGLSDEKRAELWRLGMTILEMLATDRVARVRQILANGLRSMRHAPREIMTMLARDADPEVAGPVIESSPVLDEDDLIALLEDDTHDWKRQAIVRRDGVGPGVAEKVAETGSEQLIGELLRNDSAHISNKTMDTLTDRAPDHPAWHDIMVRRTAMPGKMLVKLAQFVAKPLLAVILQRRGLDRASEKALDKVAAERGAGAGEQQAPKLPGTPHWARGTAAERTARSRDTGVDMAIRLHHEGRLDDEAVTKALDSGEEEFVIGALAVRAHTGVDVVRSVLASRSARAVTALCWKAQFRMRFAMEVQRRLARISYNRMLTARDGVDYPLPPDEMERQLDYFLR